MFIRYIYDETNSEHKVELYEAYDDFIGLINESKLKFSNVKYTEIIKEIKDYLTNESLDTLISLFKAKLNGVVKPDGKYLNF